MKVREVITNALDYIGVGTAGLENQGGNNFNRNFVILQQIIDAKRRTFPFVTTSDYFESELSSVKYVSIDTVFCYENIDNTHYPMKIIDIGTYEKINSYPLTNGIPEYIAQEKAGGCKIFPHSTNYKIRIIGKLNSLLSITKDTELNPSPLFYQYYVQLLLSRSLCPYYQKNWTDQNKRDLNESYRDCVKNTDTVSIINAPCDDYSGARWRVRNLIKNG